MSATNVTGTAGAQLSAPGSRSRLARNIAFLAGGQLATWSLSLLWTVAVPRALGPRGLGELTIAYAVTGVVGVVASLGIGTLLAKEIARDSQRAPSLLGTAMLVRAGFVLPSIAVVALYIHVGHFQREQAVVLWLATGTMILGFFTGPYQAAFQAFERMEYIAYGDILTKAVVAFGSIVLVLMGFGVQGVVALGAAMAAVVLLLNIWWSTGKFGIDWHPDREQIRSVVVASLPYWATGLALTVYMWIDSVMLSVMSSDVVVGWYAVPTKVFSTLVFVPVIIGTAMLPRLAAAFRDGLEPLQRAGKPAMELALILSLPTAVGTALVAGPLIRDLYGAQFGPSVWVMVILALTLPPTYFNIMANQVLVASNRQVAWTKVMVAAAVINPIINFFLIRYFQGTQHNGAIGAALSLLATEVGMALVGLFLLPPIFDPWSVLRLLRAAAATAGMAVAVWMISGFGLVVEAAAGMATFGALAFILRVLTAEEIELLRKTLGRVFSRGNGRPSGRQYHGWDDVTGRSSGMFNR